MLGGLHRNVLTIGRKVIVAKCIVNLALNNGIIMA
jgi:hypothetical protein